MKPSKGYYSVIQYIHDLARGESANIGVLLFVPERGFLDARIVHDNARVRHVFGVAGDDLKRLNTFKSSFGERVKVERYNIESVEQLSKFIDTRGNQIQLTEPRFTKVTNCEELLDDLFKKLVDGNAKKKKRPKRFAKKIEQRFLTAGIQEKVQRDIPIRVPVVERDINVAFGFQNGSYNLMQAVSFHDENVDRNANLAIRHSFQGRALQSEKHADYDGGLKYRVLGRFQSNQNESISVVRRVLKENDVQLYTEKDLPELIDEIRRTGKVLDEHI